jgi:DNA-binding CsgD family transcriptional regulator
MTNTSNGRVAGMVRWTPDQLTPGHSLPLARVLDLLGAAHEHQAVDRTLALLCSTIDAGPAVAIEYVLHGGVLKQRQVVTADAARGAASEPLRDADRLVADPGHERLVALARGVHDDAMFGLRCEPGRWTAWPGPWPGDRRSCERVSVLYTLAPNTAWALHFCPPAAGARFADDVLDRLPPCALLVREIHRIVAPASAVPAERVDAAQIRLGVRATSLSGRERQICARIAGGHSTTSIAAELGIATSTVMTLRKRAYAKLGIHDRLDLCHLAA